MAQSPSSSWFGKQLLIEMPLCRVSLHHIYYTKLCEVTMHTLKTVSLVSLIAGLAGMVVFASSCHHRTVAESHPIPAPASAETAPPAAPSCNLTAEPASLSPGQSATLTWTSANATSLDLEPGLGQQQAIGSVSVTPQGSTEYTLTASGPGGNGACMARVTVVTPPTSAESPSEATVTEENLVGGALTNAGLKDAFFDLDKADLRQDAQEALKADADYLRAHPSVKVEIEGNCDARGSEEYNLGLGDRRASAARDFLVNLGVSAARLKSISFGKDRPVCTDQTEDCWQQNRRDHLAIQTPAGS
jgi:peptidoglycan-associated lipoprotein